jgi:hypothetical protein
VKPGGGLLGFRTQEGTEFNFAAGSAGDVIDGSGGNRDPEHLFQADGLRAELNLVVIPVLPPTAFVLDGIRDLVVVRVAFAKLHKVGHPGESQTVTDQSEAAGNANRRS